MRWFFTNAGKGTIAGCGASAILANPYALPVIIAACMLVYAFQRFYDAFNEADRGSGGEAGEEEVIDFEALANANSR